LVYWKPQFRVEKSQVLGEKALPEGHINILIKEAIPIGLLRNLFQK